MNIDVFGRVCPASARDYGVSTLHFDSQNRVSSGPGGPFFSFEKVLGPESSSRDVYRSCVDSLTDLFLAGFNSSVLVVGETGTGKSTLLGGESSSKQGLLNVIIENIFSKLRQDDNKYLYDTKVNRHSAQVNVQMYEVYNEQIKDLLQMSGVPGSGYVQLDQNATAGVFVKNGTSVPVRTASDGASVLRQGWSRRTEATNDYGPAQKFAAVITYIDLQLHVGENPNPNRSRLTVVRLPGLETLQEARSEVSNGVQLRQGVVSLNNVVNSLSSNTSPARVINYSNSKLTELLQEELGGNFKTKALVCLRSTSQPGVLSEILSFCSHLAQVKNFPILNDSFAQNLLSQYRCRILDLQGQLGFNYTGRSQTGAGTRDELIQVKTENVKLRDQLERLNMRMDQMTGKYGYLATTKTDISQQLLMTEEEKLKVSQTLVEMQIENNRLKEDSESMKFELTNKILSLETELMETAVSRDKHSKVNHNATQRLEELEQDRKDLADEYVVLKTNYLALTKEHEREVSRNEELSLELLNLVNAKATLMKQLEMAEKMNYRLGDPDAEVDRVRTMLGRFNPRKAEDIHASQREREDMEKQLFGNEKRFETELDRVKTQYEDTIRKLEDKISSMGEELKESRYLTRDRQQKVSELNAKLITMRSEKDQLESLYNRGQHKLKDTNEECRTRLIKYVEDIAQYMDKAADGLDTGNELRGYVDSMMKDIRKSYKSREEQLGAAVQRFKSRLQQVIQKHEELIVAYRNLQFRFREKGLGSSETGPDESAFYLSDPEFQTSQQQEVRRLKDELNSALNEVDTLKLRVRYFEVLNEKLSMAGDKLVDSFESKELGQTRSGVTSENWSSLRKQLREFTLNTQQQLEQERAELISKNQVLEEQLKESQSYIDSHLIRYKEEIVRLRRRYGEDDGRLISPAPLTSKYNGHYIP